MAAPREQAAIVEAVEANDEGRALALLAAGADPNAPFHFLIEGDKPGEPPSEAWSPVLDRALKRRMMRLAMAIVIDPRFKPDGWYFGTHGSLRRDAVATGDIAFAQAVFARQPPAEHPRWVLAAAAAGGSVAMLRWLKDDQGIAVRRHGIEALCKAVQQDRRDAVVWLLDQGVPVNGRSELGRWSPVTHAGAFGRADLLDLLLSRGATITLADEAGREAVLWARINGHAALAERLQALAR
ncbi:hypothetical protein [Zavarzinia sp. CC-PAN008]|uniref:hypothetical protein n=1 Tax=Zavarzinia sp. CC-PAN008 TaxID=3243332 RepID=UPI003F748E0E